MNSQLISLILVLIFTKIDANQTATTTTEFVLFTDANGTKSKD